MPLVKSPQRCLPEETIAATGSTLDTIAANREYGNEKDDEVICHHVGVSLGVVIAVTINCDANPV